MNFTRMDKTGLIVCSVGTLISFICLAYVDRWTENMLKDVMFAIFGWMFLVLSLRIRPNR